MGFAMLDNNQQTFLSTGKHYTDSFSLYRPDLSLLKLKNYKNMAKSSEELNLWWNWADLLIGSCGLAWVVTSLILLACSNIFSGSRRSSCSNCLQCLSCSLMYGNIGCDFIPVTHEMEKGRSLLCRSKEVLAILRRCCCNSLCLSSLNLAFVSRKSFLKLEDQWLLKRCCL